MFDTTVCTEIISIIEAILFGVDGACVNIGLPSVLGSIAVFVVGVVVLRYLLSLSLRRVFPSIGRRKDDPGLNITELQKVGRQPVLDDGPIRSTGAWGRKKR